MKKRFLALGSMLLAVLAATALADPSPEAEAFLPKAEAGDADAQYALGKELQKEKEYDEALPWFEKAAAQGHVLAINSLGHFYELGLAMRQDHQKGFEFYSRAANLGSAEAMWNISNMYRAGELGEPDMVAACTWAVRTDRFSDPADKKLLAHVHNVLPRLEHALSSDQLAKCRKEGGAWTPRPG